MRIMICLYLRENHAFSEKKINLLIMFDVIILIFEIGTFFKHPVLQHK